MVSTSATRIVARARMSRARVLVARTRALFARTRVLLTRARAFFTRARACGTDAPLALPARAFRVGMVAFVHCCVIDKCGRTRDG